MFMLLGSARTGSTTLASLMRAHPDVKSVIGEPFNKNDHSWGDRLVGHLPISKMQKLRHLFDSVVRDFGEDELPDGLKVMRYNIHAKVCAQWIREDNMPVVYLERKNLLRMAVSNILSKRCKAWNKKQYPENYRSLKHSAIPIKHVRSAIEWTRHIELSYREDWDCDCLRVCYEDFYFHNGWRSILPRIQQHLGYRPIINNYMQRLMRTERVNDERTYLNIANVHEIERKCGSNETGWLFNRCPLFL